MANKKIRYSETFIKNVERFNAQRVRMEKIQRAYETHTQRYYAKSKRHNLLSNTYEKYKNINPLSLSPKRLNEILKENAKTIRELGYNSKMSGDMAEASVLVELNNEAYEVVDFGDSEGAGYDTEHLMREQERVFGEMLVSNLKELRLTTYQLDKILSRSILPDYVIESVRSELIDYYKKLRR